MSITQTYTHTHTHYKIAYALHKLMLKYVSDCATIYTCDQILCANEEKNRFLERHGNNKIATYTSLERNSNTLSYYKSAATSALLSQKTCIL